MNDIVHRRVAVAIIEEFGKILIARRKEGGLFPGLWELPGGKCREGEDPSQCVVREVMEETGLSVTAGQRAGVVEYAYSKFTAEIHVYFCQVQSGEARPLESQAIRWIGWEEIDHYQFPEANKKVFSQASRLRATSTSKTPEPKDTKDRR